MSPPFASKGFELKTIVKQAIAKDYTDIVIINEDKKTPNALVHIHLPDGPTAHYKLSRWGASGVSWSWGCTLHALRASVRVCLPSHALRHFFFFLFSSVTPSNKVENKGRATTHYPEVIVNNFHTRLGHQVRGSSKGACVSLRLVERGAPCCACFYSFFFGSCLWAAL